MCDDKPMWDCLAAYISFYFSLQPTRASLLVLESFSDFGGVA